MARLAVAGVFIAALVVVLGIIRPFAAGPVASDATASVLYFDRMMSGQRLEAFVNTTPKPLLTLVFGVAHTLFADWRAVSLTTIAVAAAAAALGAWLMASVGGRVAAVLAAVFLTLGASLLAEISWSFGLPWAVACWLAAGVALTRPRPRYALAGTALMLGALARPETFTLIGAATAWLGYLAARRRLPRGALWLLVAWLAVPVMLVHDLMLTGDPLYWLRVSSIYAEGRTTVKSLREVVTRLVSDSLADPFLLVAAAVGVAGAMRSARGRIVAGGLIALAGGTAMLLVVVAAAGRQTLGHYYYPIWIAIGLAACLGVGYLVEAVVGRWDARGPSAGRRGSAAIVTVGLAAILGYIVLGPELVSPRALAGIDMQRQIAANSDAAARKLGEELGDIPDPPSGQTALRRADPAGYRILVPRPVQSRIAVDLGLPITVVGPLIPDRKTSGLIHAGQLVYHDPLADADTDVAAAFEDPSPVTIDGVTFELVSSDGGATWIWRSVD